MGARRPLGSETGHVPERLGALVFDVAAREFDRWRAGDREALGRLVTLVTPMLWHVARAYRLDRQTAEDVIQATWMTLVRYADSIADPQAVIRWLTVTARREAWRCARASRRVEVIEDQVLDLRVADIEGPEAAVLRNDRDEALWQAVAGLNDRCQRLLRIVAFADRPNYAHISRELDMPLGSIGPTRARCLDKLRAILSAVADWRMA